MAVESPEIPRGKRVSGSEDMTGRDRIMRNTLWSWIGQMVFVVAGFVMPRLIDRHIGQVSLGIWDFSWSVVSYFGIAGLGVGSSVNRYVAKLRAAGETRELNETVSSVVCIQVVVAILTAVVTAATVWALPLLFKERLGPELADARWVVALLGASFVVQMAFDTFRGVVTGCHRWDLHNVINAGSYGVTVIAMIVILTVGGGLRSLGAAYFLMGLATEIWRYRVARKLCPELRIETRLASWAQARKMISFGVSSVLSGLCPLIIVQGTSLLVVRHLGPAAMAVFARPNGVVRNALTFVSKYALILTPTAGSLQGAGLQREIVELVRRATRNSVAMALPVVLFLSILGEQLLQIWMGPRYAGGHLMAILAVGAFLPMSQASVLNILVGLNLHGAIARINVLLSVAMLAAGWAVMTLKGWSLFGGVILIGVSLSLVNGVSVFVYTCRRLDLPVKEYLRKSFFEPMIACLPLALFLWAAREWFSGSPSLAVAAGCVGTVAILGPIYWKFIFPSDLRSLIREKAEKYGLMKAVKTS